MNKERAAELLPIIKAFSEGKKIRRKSPGKDYWVDLKGELVDFNIPGDYEIAPEPLVLYVNVYDDEKYSEIHAHRTKEDAQRIAAPLVKRVAVMMVEAD